MAPSRLQQILVEVVATRTVTTTGVTTETRHYLSSRYVSAANFQGDVQRHWGIENRLHWVLDAVFLRRPLPQTRWSYPPLTAPSSANSSSIRCERNPKAKASTENETSALYPMSIVKDGLDFNAFTLGAPLTST